jgi:hypothetical protein
VSAVTPKSISSALVTAGLDVSITALETYGVAGIAAGQDVSIFAGSPVAGTIAAGRHMSIEAADEVSATLSTEAGNASVHTLTSFTGSLHAGTVSEGHATVSALATITGDVTASGDIDVAAWGDVSHTLDAGGNASVFAAGNLDIDAQAGGHLSIAGIGNATVIAQTTNGDLDVTVAGSLTSLAVPATGGNLSVTAFADANTLDLNATGTATILGVGPVNSLDLIADGGASLSLFHGSAPTGTVTSSAGGVSIFSHGPLLMDVTADGDIQAVVFDNVQGDLESTNGGHISVFSLDWLSSNVTTSGDIELISKGTMFPRIFSGDQVSLIAIHNATPTIDSAGSLELLAGDDITSAIIDVDHIKRIAAGGHISSSTITASDDVESFTSLEGITSVNLTAGGTIQYLFTQGDLRQSDIEADEIGRIIVRGDMTVSGATGIIDTVITSANDIELIHSYHDIEATITAGDPINSSGVIHRIEAWGVVDETLVTAGSGTAPIHEQDVGPYETYPDERPVNLAELEADLQTTLRDFLTGTEQVNEARLGMIAKALAERAAAENAAEETLLALELMTPQVLGEIRQGTLNVQTVLAQAAAQLADSTAGFESTLDRYVRDIAASHVASAGKTDISLARVARILQETQTGISRELVNESFARQLQYDGLMAARNEMLDTLAEAFGTRDSAWENLKEKFHKIVWERVKAFAKKLWEVSKAVLKELVIGLIEAVPGGVVLTTGYYLATGQYAEVVLAVTVAGAVPVIGAVGKATIKIGVRVAKLLAKSARVFGRAAPKAAARLADLAAAGGKNLAADAWCFTKTLFKKSECFVGDTLVVLADEDVPVYAANGVYLPADRGWERYALNGLGLAALLSAVGIELRRRKRRLSLVADADGHPDDDPAPDDDTDAAPLPTPTGPLLAPSYLQAPGFPDSARSPSSTRLAGVRLRLSSDVM